MTNKRESAICRRRGHAGILGEAWTQCKWCGTWVREVRRIEEREDEPPEAELHPGVVSRRNIDQVRRELDRLQTARSGERRGTADENAATAKRRRRPRAK